MAKSYNDVLNHSEVNADAFELVIDAAMDKAVMNKGVVVIDTPSGITDEIFTILVGRYKAVGWNRVSMNLKTITFEKDVKICGCGKIFSYNSSDIKPDSRDGDYLVCPGCGKFIAVRTTTYNQYNSGGQWGDH